MLVTGYCNCFIFTDGIPELFFYVLLLGSVLFYFAVFTIFYLHVTKINKNRSLIWKTFPLISPSILISHLDKKSRKHIYKIIDYKNVIIPLNWKSSTLFVPAIPEISGVFQHYTQPIIT